MISPWCGRMRRGSCLMRACSPVLMSCFIRSNHPKSESLIAICKVGSLSARFINLVNLAGPFVSPKGITLHWNCPRWVENAVLGLSSSFTCICRYPDARYRHENHGPPPSASKTSSVLANGIASFYVHNFSLR